MHLCACEAVGATCSRVTRRRLSAESDDFHSLDNDYQLFLFLIATALLPTESYSTVQYTTPILSRDCLLHLLYCYT